MDAFRDWLREEKQLKKYTIKCYVSAVSGLLEFVGGVPTKIKSHLYELQDKGIKGTTLNYYLSALKAYDEFMGTSYFSSIRKFAIEPPIKGILSEDEINAFLDLPQRPRETDRNYKMFSMFWKCLSFSGMRPGECAKLTTDNIDFGMHVFHLLNTKTGENRMVPISPVIENELRAYVRGCKGLLFKKTTDEPITKDTWSRDFLRRLKTLGIKRPGLTPYSTRHSFITRNVTEMSLFTLQKIVGHKKADTTQKYTHLTTKDTVKAIKNDPLALRDLPAKEKLARIAHAIKALYIDDDELLFKLTESGNAIELFVALK